MNIGRIFASAFIRKIAAVLALLLLAALGVGTARAQDYSNCNSVAHSTAICPSNSSAQAAATSVATALCNSGSFGCSVVQSPQYFNTYSGSGGRPVYIVVYRLCANSACTSTSGQSVMRIIHEITCLSGQEFFDYLGECAPKCSSRTSYVVDNASGMPGGSTACNAGCVFALTHVGDGTSHISPSGNQCPLDFSNQCTNSGKVWNAALSMCQPPPETCAAGQVKDANGNCKSPECPENYTLNASNVCVVDEPECAHGTVLSPSGQCLPGEGACAVGEARGKDGTCKRDDNNDGMPDEEEEEGDSDNKDGKKFSGGDGCDSPPTCSGDAIMCGQARIQWRIECNTRNDAKVGGGACGAGGVPICTGKNCNAVEYAQLVQQWRTACAVEKLAGNGTGEQPGWTKVTGNGMDGMPEHHDGRVVDGQGINPSSRIDSTGLGLGSSCPVLPELVLPLGVTVNLNEYDWWCTALAIIRAFNILLGTFLAYRILMGER